MYIATRIAMHSRIFRSFATLRRLSAIPVQRPPRSCQCCGAYARRWRFGRLSVNSQLFGKRTLP